MKGHINRLTSGDFVERREAARALVNLAVNATNQDAIREAGGLAPLIGCLRDQEPNVRHYAARALANIAWNATNKDAIREAGGLVPLIGCLSDANADVRKNAVGALAVLPYDSATNRDAIRDAQGLRPLIGCLRDASSDVRRYASAALGILASNDTNQDAIRDAQGLPPLIGCLRDPGTNVRNYAARALVNLASNATNQDAIRDAEGLPPLIGCLRDPDTNVRHYTAWTLTNLAANATNKDAIRDAQGLPPLIGCLSDANADVRNYAARALVNLASNAMNQDAIRDAEGLPPLIGCLRDPDTNVRHYTAWTLTNLAANATNKDAIRDAQGLPPLIGCLRDPDANVRHYAARALANLPNGNATNQDAIREAGGLAPLIGCLRDPDTNVRHYAASALLNLAVNATNRDAIREAGGLVPLIGCLRDPDANVRHYAASALVNLAVNATNQDAIRDGQGLPPLIGCLRDPDANVRHYAAFALAHLANGNATNQDAIREAVGLAPLIGCLRDPDTSVRHYAASALVNLAVNATNRDAIREAGDLAPLIGCLRDPDANVRHYAAFALANLALNATNKDAIRDAEGLPPLIGCLRDQDVNVRHQAAKVLVNLAFNHESNKNHILEAQGINELVNCCSDEGEYVRQYAVFAILLLIEGHQVNAQALLKLNGIDVLLARRDDKNEETKNYVELALAVLVFSGLDDSYPQLNTTKLNIALLVNTLGSTEYGARYVAINMLMRMSESKLYRAVLKASAVCTRMNLLLEDEDEHPLVKERARFALNHINAFLNPEAADHLMGGGAGKEPDFLPHPEPKLPAAPGPIVLQDERTFEISDRDRLGGSALISGVFRKIDDDTLWVAKCNVFRSELAAEADACKEIMASGIYAHFGVNVPKTAMARLPIKLPDWAEGNVENLECEADRTHTVYMLSEIIAGFHLFGSIPIWTDPERFVLNIPGQGDVEVQGLGHVLAVALLINDYDVIGGSGGNIGVQVVDGIARCIKIDPGEAFNTQETLQVLPRQVRVATQAPNGVLTFDNLPSKVRAEFLETMALIIAISDAEIEQLIKRPGAQSVSDGEMGAIMHTIMVSRRDDLQNIYALDLQGVLGRRPNNSLQTLPVHDRDIDIALATLHNTRQTRQSAPNLGGGADAVNAVDALDELAIPYKDITYNPTDPTTLLGSGTFADVYEATWQGIPVAFKRLKVQVVNDDIKKELRHEGVVMKHLRHPNIVTFYGICSEPNHLGLVIKFAKNGSLSSILYHPATELTWQWRVKVALGIAMGLNYLHTRPLQPLLHRDLKSLNVLMQGNKPKLADFGLSKVKDIAMTSLRQGIEQGGTLGWMAQELLGDPDAPYTTACDIFSFAIILSEIATRRQPWAGLGVRLIAQVIQGKRPPLPAEGLPPGFAALTGRCWAVDPTTRPKMQEVVEELQTIKREL